MGFNWVTFFAQIVNLFVLVWLLKRFLYRPILSAIEKRQAYIEDKVKKADEAMTSAQKQEDLLQKKKIQWDKDRQKRLNTLDEKLKNYREEQIRLIQDQTLHLRNQTQEALNRENLSLRLEIRDMIAQNFLNLTRQVLKDLSGLSPLEQALSLFRKKVLELTTTELKSIRDILKKKKEIIIYTSGPLPEKAQKSLNAFLKEQFGESDILYRIQPELILGVEALIGETVLEWNLKSYLDTFEGNLNKALSGLIIKE